MIEGERKKERNSSVDIIRIVALVCVIAVHFFKNSSFYKTEVGNAKIMLVAVTLRNVLMICVPLFIILTGYLMCHKKLEKKYYKGILKTLYVYVIASIICIIYKLRIGTYKYGLLQMFLAIFDFSGAGYSWYIEMYIGLFLLIPFLNLIYNNLQNKNEKLMLIGTFLFLTSLPTITNCYNFLVENWWKNPSSLLKYNKLLPDYWGKIYPITYYFIGCYIREFKPNMNKLLNIVLFIIIGILQGIFNYYRSYGSEFIWGAYSNYPSVAVTAMTTLIFVLIINIDFNKLPNILRNIIAYIADLCLGAYLVSEVCDKIVYSRLLNRVPDFVNQFKYMIIVVPIVLAGSMLLSALINISYKILEKCISIIKNKFSKEKKCFG